MYALLTLLAVSAAANAARPYGLITDPTAFASYSYDYIVVGGGNGGLTVAARLSENPNITVGVIEAGPYYPDDPLVNTPFFLGEAVDNPAYDWSLQTVPQQYAAGRSIGTSAGRMLGGSSALNFMTYGRASKADYDAWAALGNDQWNWDSLLPYFMKSENVTPGQTSYFPGTTGAPGIYSEYQGTTGPVDVSFVTNDTGLTTLVPPFVQSFENIGGWPNADPDSGNATGVLQSPRSVDYATGQRSYSATAFYLPYQNNTNYVILTGALASRLLLSEQGGSVVASGVEFYVNSTKYVVNATQEVIVATGAIKTPQLLELSGIGNSTILSSLGIPVLVDLPGVGENLQDHTLIGADFILKEPSPITWDTIRLNATYAAEQQQLYNTTGKGMYATSNAVLSFHPLQVFVNSSGIQSMLSTLDEEMGGRDLTPMQQTSYAIQKQLVKEGQVAQLELAFAPAGGHVPSDVPLQNRSYISVISVTSRPFSRGTVHINSTNFTASPVIDPQYYSYSFDSTTSYTGIKTARQIAGTQPLAAYVDQWNSPPANVTSDEDLLSWVQNFTISVYHPIGTATLAPREIGGVVDQTLRVYGTSNLRIIDGSVMPFLAGTHTQSGIYAIAERGADIIKAGL